MKDDAVSDVVGAILLVGITVAMMAGLSVVVLSMPGPPDKLHADLTLAVEPGSDGWGTGDEAIALRHLGGEPLAGARIRIVLDGVETLVTPTDQGFADGKLTIGETWRHVATIAQLADVRVQVTDPGRTQLLATTSVLAGLVAQPQQGIDDMPALTMVQGTVVDPDNLVGADGLFATLQEASTVGSQTFRLNPGNIATSVSITNADRALLSDDLHARMNAATDLLGVHQFNLAQAGTITDVQIGIEGKKNAASGADARIWYRIGGVDGATQMTRTFVTGADQTFKVSVFNDRAWTPTDIANMQVRVQRLTSPQELWVDQLFVEVTLSQPPTHALAARLDFTNVNTGSQHVVQLGYRTNVESFRVQVWDWTTGTFNTRGAVLTSPTATTWSYALSPPEYNAATAAVRLRILDADPAIGPGSVLLDYARVVTT